MPKMNLDWKTAEDFITDAFVGAGVPREDAKICTDVLLESDRRGIESHGCNRFKPIYIDRIKACIQQPVTEFEIIKETPTTAVVDGHHGMGQVIGYKAMQMAIDKAKQYGMGMVAVRNSCHYGIAGYYATMATKAGCIGMTGTNARPSVAPTFGVEGLDFAFSGFDGKFHLFDLVGGGGSGGIEGVPPGEDLIQLFGDGNPAQFEVPAAHIQSLEFQQSGNFGRRHSSSFLDYGLFIIIRYTINDFLFSVKSAEQKNRDKKIRAKKYRTGIFSNAVIFSVISNYFLLTRSA